MYRDNKFRLAAGRDLGPGLEPRNHIVNDRLL